VAIMTPIVRNSFYHALAVAPRGLSATDSEFGHPIVGAVEVDELGLISPVTSGTTERAIHKVQAESSCTQPGNQADDDGRVMTTTALSDAELLAQARTGDEAAFTELYVRHHAAARRLATTYRRSGDPDDLVNEAFERVLGALRRGAGPTEAFRAYLFVTLRRLAANHIARTHDEPVEEVPEPVLAVEHSPPMDPADRQIVLQAYESLSERSQAVLWHTTVEGRPPRELAGILGMSANAAAALAYRAREKLRQAYLQAHLQAAPRPQCEPHRSRLGAYVREGLSRRDKSATDAHLSDCGSCAVLLGELVTVNEMLVPALAPSFAATAAATATAGAAAATGGAAGAGGLAFAGKKLVSKARNNPGATAGGVAVAAVVATAALAMMGTSSDKPLPEEPPPEAQEVAAPPPEEPEPTEEPPLEVFEPEVEPPPEQPEAEEPQPTEPEPAEPEPAALAPPAPEPAPAAPPPEPEPSPPPAPTTTTTQPSPPPEEPESVVVWVPGGSHLRITLTNDSGQTMDGVFVQVDLTGGAVLSGAPSGCGWALAIVWSATCSVQPIEPGATRVVEVPAQVTGPGQVAYTRLCQSSWLGADCILGRPELYTTPLT
jgi:RNA polymerase sigma factor (sigma-70 family)